MKLRTTFIHWGYQCPWCEKSIETLTRLAQDGEIACRFEDVTATDRRTPLVSSFLTSAEGLPGTGSPILEKNRRMLFERAIPLPAPVDAEKPQAALDTIKELNADTIQDSIAVCNNHTTEKSKKERWYAQNADAYFGFVGYKAGKPVCIIEMSAAADCPFDRIERSADIAQIICIYSNAEDRDYKLDILNHAEMALAGAFKSIQIIAGRRTRYPNGTKALFEAAGYAVTRELGPQYLLGKGYDEVYLMRKDLRTEP